MNKPLFYLAHPFSGHHENITKALNIQNELLDFEIFVLNPVGTFPLVTDNEKKAIKRCKLMFKICDALILTGSWENSIGCLREIRWAKRKRKPIYIYKHHKFYTFKDRKLITDLELERILGG